MSKKTTRRKFLYASVVSSIGAFSGCTGGSDDDSVSTTPSTKGRTTTNTQTTTEMPTSTSRKTTTTDTHSTQTTNPTTTQRQTKTTTTTSHSTQTTTPTTQTTTTTDSAKHIHKTDESSAEFADTTLKKAQKVGIQVQKSVVRLGGGTGWVIGDGYVLTNSHVVQHSDTLKVETYDGRKGTAKRIGYHEDLAPDIALVKTDFTDLPKLPTKSRDVLEQGQPLITVGHPMSVGEWVISIGRHNGYEPGINWLLSTVVTESGNSGGPLVTLNGNVVGCIHGGTSNDNRKRVNRSKKVFTKFPANRKLTTATPMETILKWVRKWK